jgi:hypothetical protein
MAAIGLALIAAQGLYIYFVTPDSDEDLEIGLALVIAGIVFGVYCAGDARRLARRAPEVRLTRYNRAWIYLAVAALFIAVMVAVSVTPPP